TKVVFAITEPEAGSNTHRLATTATRDGDGWVLRGTKHYISGVDEAAALVVVARSGRGPDGSPLLSLFVVPTDAPGLVRT
ncbi:acyl-CoA dehydrogenase family protein, partial [Escherichia coli]